MQMTLSADAAIDPALREAVQRAVGLDSLRAGRHVVRDAQRLKTGETVVRKVWAARVQPPAAAPACLASVATDRQMTVVLAVPDDQDGSSIVADLLQYETQRSDPVAAALTSLDLWSGGGGIPLAGCSYSVFVDTTQLQAVVRFGNPRDPSRAALQAALLDVARWFVTGEERAAVTAFVNRWQAALGAVLTS